MSDCGICIGGDYDGEVCEFYNISFPKSKKSHKCGECHREIKTGDIYEKTCGKWGGDFYTHKTCMDCVNIRDGLSCGSVIFGELWYYVNEIFSQFNTSCLAKIKTVSAKEYMLERWRIWKGVA